MFPDKNVLVSVGSDSIREKFARKSLDCIDNAGRAITGVCLDPNKKSLKYAKLKDREGELFFLTRGTSTASLGASLIVADDLIPSHEAAQSQLLRDKTWDWFSEDLLTRLDPEDGKIVVVLSSRHPDDLGERIKEANDLIDPSQRFAVLKLPAINDKGEALWPERRPLEWLIATRDGLIAKGQSYVWDCLFQQDPTVNQDSLLWPREYLEGIFYDTLPSDISYGLRVIACDPSKGSQSNRRKYSLDYSCALYGIYDDKTGHIWVEDGFLFKLDSAGLAVTFSQFLEQHTDITFGVIEDNMDGAEQIIADVIKECVRLKIPAPIEGWKSKDKKDIRIMTGLGPLLRAKRIHIKKRFAFHNAAPQEGWQQMRNFPSASHDDFPDALDILQKVCALILTRFPRQGKPKIGSTPWQQQLK